METIWCIEHEDLVMAQKFPSGFDGIVHQYLVNSEHTLCGWEMDWCTFDEGWAYCAMPEERDDWDMDEELEQVEEEPYVDPFDNDIYWQD